MQNPKTFQTSLLMALFLLFGSTAFAQTGTLDVDQSSSSTNGYFATGTGYPSLWQSFKPTTNGTLSDIDFRLGSITTGGSTTLNVYSGEGTGGTLLHSETISYNSGAIGVWQTVTLTSGPTLTSGTTYTIEVEDFFSWMLADASNSNPYPDGRSSYASSYDFVFKTYMNGTTGGGGGTGTGPDDDWTGAGTGSMYTSNLTDKVGIGLTNPGRPLTVKGIIKASHNNEQTNFVEIGHGGTHGYVNKGGTGNLDIRLGGTTRMTFLTNGKVGIGTTAPAFKLDVQGDVYARAGWFRTAGARGLYSQSYQIHFYPVKVSDKSYWRLRSERGLQIYDKNNVRRGGIYHNSGTAFGLLDGDGNWALRITKDAHNTFHVDNSEKMRINTDGSILMGTTTKPAVAPANIVDGTAPYLLFVNGGIFTKEVKVQTPWADYVFEDDYKLTSLEDVAQHIEEKGHLHNTPSAQELEENGGVELARTTVNQQEKIEEIFLHLIQMNEEISQLNKTIKDLQTENEALKNK